MIVLLALLIIQTGIDLWLGKYCDNLEDPVGRTLMVNSVVRFLILIWLAFMIC